MRVWSFLLIIVFLLMRKCLAMNHSCYLSAICITGSLFIDKAWTLNVTVSSPIPICSTWYNKKEHLLNREGIQPACNNLDRHENLYRHRSIYRMIKYNVFNNHLHYAHNGSFSVQIKISNLLKSPWTKHSRSLSLVFLLGIHGNHPYTVMCYVILYSMNEILQLL